MNQRPADTRRGTFGDARGYRLRLAIAAGIGFISSSLNILAAGGSTPRSSLPAAPAQQVLLVLPFALASGLVALVSLGLFGEMGHWATRREGAIRSGVRAATGAGIFFGWGAAIPSIGVIALQGGFSSPPTLDGPILPLLVIQLVAMDLLVACLLVGIVGALAGSVGAAIGRSQYRRQANA